ncbi:MAG TPA: hypothetical protein VHA82_03380 [Ramlibacter sp.]|uniref:hypothetical protein n=1 Tax=Ramlibacter sp. TaxID=1917967 RepID=UPI002BC93048|nr:hypothetical protein [Ramlibacter sp.]HVZ42829.1 hypothetical protein [Ramlibacter sp.]
MTTTNAQTSASVAPLEAMMEFNRWQIALATEGTIAVMRGVATALEYWQDLASTGWKFQDDVLRSYNLADPAAILASANVLD